MASSHKHMIALGAACIALIGVAVALKLSTLQEASAPTRYSAGQTRSGGISPDASFYSPSATQDQSSSAHSQAGTVGTAKSSSSAAAAPAGPVVTARAYLVGDVSTGEVLMERDGKTVLPVASMSKLITAIAATDTMSPTTTVTITPPEYDVASDTSRIAPGETFTLSEMLYPLLLNSSNVAAEALASTSDRAKFLELMSSYAWEIGMPSTYFADPSGLSPQNQSTAEDFFALARYLYKSRPDILAITRTVSTSTATTTDHGAHDFASIHPFVTDPDFLGGKTGHTPEAGDTMLTILNIGGRPIAIIVLGADSGSRQSDTQILAAEAGKMVAGR